MNPANPPLSCSVRGCGLALTRGSRAWTCARGHAYDVARSGYVNLLQPQDRKSLAAGDSREAVEARARLLASGVGRTIVDRFVARAAALVHAPGATVVDLGCGSGDVLGGLAAARPIEAIGIDLSTAAAEVAARRYPDLTWAVANADRQLPLLERTAAIVLSFHARRNPAECARILAPGGFLLIALPAADDLIELREAALGARVERERADAVVAGHDDKFALVDRSTFREQHHLQPDRLQDLLHGTYRAARTAAKSRPLRALQVTLSSEVLVFAKRSPSA